MEQTVAIRRIGAGRKEDIKLVNQPFLQFGRLIPRYDGSFWSSTEELFSKEAVSEITFPNENYDYDVMRKEHFFVGAYDEQDRCVGLAIYKKDWFRYLYLSDMKVNADMRGMGIGGKLLEEGGKIARENGYRGVYLIAQDTNLAACRFYLGHGFTIGGLNTRQYDGTGQEGSSDVYFYRDFT